MNEGEGWKGVITNPHTLLCNEDKREEREAIGIEEEIEWMTDR